jgi:hypothetical protein
LWHALRIGAVLRQGILSPDLCTGGRHVHRPCHHSANHAALARKEDRDLRRRHGEQLCRTGIEYLAALLRVGQDREIRRDPGRAAVGALYSGRGNVLEPRDPRDRRRDGHWRAVERPQTVPVPVLELAAGGRDPSLRLFARGLHGADPCGDAALPGPDAADDRRPGGNGCGHEAQRRPGLGGVPCADRAALGWSAEDGALDRGPALVARRGDQRETEGAGPADPCRGAGGARPGLASRAAGGPARRPSGRRGPHPLHGAFRHGRGLRVPLRRPARSVELAGLADPLPQPGLREDRHPGRPCPGAGR